MRGQDSKHLPVHIVDRRGVKQHGANGPTQATARTVRIHPVASRPALLVLQMLLVAAIHSCKILIYRNGIYITLFSCFTS
jgi:hypothetical protein